MDKKINAVLWSGALLATTISTLNWTAFQNGWYWKFVWFDLVMHFLGGALISLLAWWLLQKVGLEYGAGKSAVIVVVVALIVGILWEFFEYAIGFFPASTRLFVEDTSLDIVMDILGAISATVILVRKKTHAGQ